MKAPTDVSLTTPTDISPSVSVSTPRGNQPSIRSDIKTTSVASLPPPEDLSRDLNRLADALEAYDENRGAENRNLGDNVRNLQNELRDLSDFLRMRPTFMEARVGRSTESSVEVVEEPEFATDGSSQLSRSNSSVSFLSSHHSDDWELYHRPDSPFPPASSGPSYRYSSSSSTSTPVPRGGSGGSSSPPSPPSSLSPSSSSMSASTIVPPAPPQPSLNEIRNLLQALWDGQVSTNHLLDQLRDRPPPDTNDLMDRLRRIEELLAQFGERAMAPPETPVSERLVSAPIPTQLPRGLSLAQQLEDLLTSATSRPMPPLDHPPPLRPFEFIPSAITRPRSASPIATIPRADTEPPSWRSWGHVPRPLGPFPNLAPGSLQAPPPQQQQPQQQPPAQLAPLQQRSHIHRPPVQPVIVSFISFIVPKLTAVAAASSSF